MPVTLNAPVPDFTAASTDAVAFSLSAFAEQQLVLYFYPKDNTPGCTSEGLGFAERHAEFLAVNTQVFGISRDSVKSHEKFQRSQGFPFALLSDTDETLCRLFDVIKPKKLYGKEYIGIERSTFLLDKKGILRQEWRGVKVPGHINAVLAAATALHQQGQARG